MDKSTWIAEKIAKLIREGKSREQSVAIAISMWNRGDHKQEGGDIQNQTPEQQNYFKKLQTLLSNYTPALQPIPMAQLGGSYKSYGSTGNYVVDSYTKPGSTAWNIRTMLRAADEENEEVSNIKPEIPITYNDIPEAWKLIDSFQKKDKTLVPVSKFGKKEESLPLVFPQYIHEWDFNPQYQQGGQLPIAQEGDFLTQARNTPLYMRTIAQQNAITKAAYEQSQRQSQVENAAYSGVSPQYQNLFFNQPQSANAWMQSLPQPTTNFVATTPPTNVKPQAVVAPPVVAQSTQNVAVPPTTQATTPTVVPTQQNLIKPTVDDTNFSDISSLAQPTSSKEYIDSLKGSMLTPYGESLQTQASSVAGLPQKEVEKNVAQNDWIKYNILNPYSGGMDLNTRLAYTGQQFGQGNTGMGLVGAGLTALGGVRSFLSGYASGKGQQTLEQQMYDRLYNSDENLYTMAQQGGGIHIDESHKGEFTAKANSAGMGVQEYAHHVMSHKENFDTATVKQANFAINATKFNHQEGGDVKAPKYKGVHSYYQEGGEYELSDEEIQDLLSKGYKLE